jgi:hypothetical protein
MDLLIVIPPALAFDFFDFTIKINLDCADYGERRFVTESIVAL